SNIRVGYQGSWTDPTTGKVSAQARWYTPGTGSFASRDPMDVPFTSAASINRYLYAGANPLAYNDPTGYWPEWLEDGVSAAGGVAKDIGGAVVELGETTVDYVVEQGIDVRDGFRNGGIRGGSRALSKVALKKVPIVGWAWEGYSYSDYVYHNYGDEPSPQPQQQRSQNRRDQPDRDNEPDHDEPTDQTNRPHTQPRPAQAPVVRTPPTVRTTSSGGTPAPTVADTVNLEWLNAPLITATNPTNIPAHRPARPNANSGGPGLHADLGGPPATPFQIPQCKAPLRCIGDTPKPVNQTRNRITREIRDQLEDTLDREPSNPDCASTQPGTTPLSDTCQPQRPDHTESCTLDNSFDGDTPVLLADGTTTPIRNIKIGDQVLA
ncbi:RHS repeat-associated core domain-containing protein, partial [Parafrankia elaeagni]|uniref:RHS repeat-associated core domain-containing protein n=1 Tax=Parafrankia elaeagni TaxID=222534 RepID=UPI00055040D1